jgi:hypothetical protein
MFYISSS